MTSTTTVYGVTPPSHVLKSWEPCSMNLASGGEYLRDRLVPGNWGNPIRCVIWENTSGGIALVIGEYANGRRAEHRRASGNFRLTLTWWETPEARLDRDYRAKLAA